MNTEMSFSIAAIAAALSLALSISPSHASTDMATQKRAHDAIQRAYLQAEAKTAQGGVDSGGGNVISCPGLFSAELELADASMSKHGNAQHLDFFLRFLSKSEVIEAVSLYSDRVVGAGMGKRLKDALASLDFRYLEGSLPPKSDHGITGKELVSVAHKKGYWSCRVEQLADQVFSARYVNIDAKLFNSLPPVSRVLLFVHEGFMNIWNQDGRPESEHFQVRRIVTQMIDSELLTQLLIEATIKRLNLPNRQSFFELVYRKAFQSALNKTCNNRDGLQFSDEDIKDLLDRGERVGLYDWCAANVSQHEFYFEANTAAYLSNLPFCIERPRPKADLLKVIGSFFVSAEDDRSCKIREVGLINAIANLGYWVCPGENFPPLIN